MKHQVRESQNESIHYTKRTVKDFVLLNHLRNPSRLKRVAGQLKDRNDGEAETIFNRGRNVTNF